MPVVETRKALLNAITESLAGHEVEWQGRNEEGNEWWLCTCGEKRYSQEEADRHRASALMDEVFEQEGWFSPSGLHYTDQHVDKPDLYGAVPLKPAYRIKDH